jgi:hypothetical protein
MDIPGLVSEFVRARDTQLRVPPYLTLESLSRVSAVEVDVDNVDEEGDVDGGGADSCARLWVLVKGGELLERVGLEDLLFEIVERGTGWSSPMRGG